MLRIGVFRGAEDEHLDLVEPVDAKDAPGVLAVRARLPPIARTVTGISQRKGGGVQDLVRVIGGQRHLGCTDQIKIIFDEVVDILSRLTQESGPFHGARLDESRRQDRHETLLKRHLHREVDQRQFELGTLTGQVVEAASGHLGTPLDVDGTEELTQFQMIFRGESLSIEVPRLTPRFQ